MGALAPQQARVVVCTGYRALWCGAESVLHRRFLQRTVEVLYSRKFLQLHWSASPWVPSSIA